MGSGVLFHLQIETKALNFKETAQSKVGSMDYTDHKPGGGDKKVKCHITHVVPNYFVWYV